MGVLIFILLIQIVYVTINTLRLIVMMRGRRGIASLVSFFEVFVYMLGLATVLNHMDAWYNFVIYCLGFAIGVYTGSLVEEKIALGFVTVQVITVGTNTEMAQKLREDGFGVTTWIGQGLSGERLVMNILTKRSRQRELINKVRAMDPKAFITSLEPKALVGGFLVNRVH